MVWNVGYRVKELQVPNFVVAIVHADVPNPSMHQTDYHSSLASSVEVFYSVRASE